MKRTTLDKLGITNYRNCSSIELTLNSEVNVFTGLNGAGKTSILDTIYYLTNGKSYFSNLDRYIYKEGASFFRIYGTLSVDGSSYQCQISSSETTKKSIKVDDKAIKKVSEYYGRFASFMIAPKDIQILVESSVERRRLINKTLSQVDKKYLVSLLDYNKLLKQRNAALKLYQKTRNINMLLINSLNAKMAPLAQYIYEQRQQYVTSIAPILSNYYKLLSDERELVTIGYRSALSEKSIETLLDESIEKDKIIGKTSEGIHKDDLILRINSQDIKKYASQGQLKSTIISLKLAQLDWVKKSSSIIPILLLDDIFDKLDSQRVEHLLSLCAQKINCQVFITDTDPGRVDNKLEKLNIEYSHYNVIEGSKEN